MSQWLKAEGGIFPLLFFFRGGAERVHWDIRRGEDSGAAAQGRRPGGKQRAAERDCDAPQAAAAHKHRQ
eukprot:2101967-Rhodomonas_salina.1